MKKIIIILLLSVSIHKTSSQVVFCPPGAEWHYWFNVDITPRIVNEQIKYERDSTVNNEIVKVLRHGRYFKWQNFGDYKLTLIRQKGDTVFFRNAATQDSWQILYNFAAQPGEGWTNNISTFKPTGLSWPTPIVTYTITVDSVKNIVQNGFTLRRLYVKYKFHPPWITPFNPIIESVTIDERTGADKFLFNFYNVKYVSDNDIFFKNLCYSDSAFGVKQFTDKPCNIEGYVGIGENYRNTNIKIHPNPTNDIFTVNTVDEFVAQNTSVSVTDLCGREVKQVEISGLNQDKIDISDLAKGVYILNLSNNNEIVYTGKLVKSE